MDTFIDDEKAAEIQKTFSYDGYQTVRRELLQSLEGFSDQQELQLQNQ